jgi:hypothetical protein
LSDTLIPSLHRVTAIHRNRLPVEILAVSNKHNRLRHIGILARPLRRKPLLLLLGHLRLLRRVAALLRGHLAGEHARSDAVHAHLDAVLGDLGREHLVDVDCRAFAGVVGEVVLRDAHVA